MQTSKTLVMVLTLLAAALQAPGIFGQTCASDADCSKGMVCHSQTVTSCTGGAGVKCDPSAVCTPTPVEPPVCSDSTVSQCAYRWQLPCNRDADCGDGFVCQPMGTTTCSASSPGATGKGSADTGSASGGAASGTGGGSGGEGVPVPPPPSLVDGGAGSEPVCTSSTSFPGTCQSKVTTCASDADCPATWTCVSTPLPTKPSVPAAFDAGPVVSPPPDSTTVTSKTCQPPSGYPRTGGGADGTGGTTGTFAPSADAGAGKGPTPPPPIPMTDGGVGAGPSVPPSQGVPEASGDGGVGKGTTPSTPPAPTANGGGTTSTAAGSTPASTGGGGCAVVSGGVRGQAALFLGLLAALALLARKRT